MKLDEQMWPRPFWAPSDDGGGGGAGDGGDGDGGDGGGAGDGGAGDPKWFEGDRFKDGEINEYLVTGGLTVEDPLEALEKVIGMHRAAEKKLGSPADTLMARPAKDQDLTEWLDQNRDVFGAPDSAEGYQIQRPDNLPEGMPWNEALENQVREIAHKYAIPQAAVQELVTAASEDGIKLYQAAADNLSGATAEMMTELQKDWGDKTQTKIHQARQAASALAEKAGLDAEGLANATAVLAEKTGDATVIRLFSAVGDMLGDDMLDGLGDGAGGLGTTPAEARQRLAELQAPDGAYAKAYAAGNRAEMDRLQPEIDRLRKIVAAA